MFTRYKTKGIILKHEDWKEADRFFTVYTQDFGKIKVLGRSIRKIDAKLRSGMKLFSLSRIEFIQGKNYKTLVDSFSIAGFNQTGEDLKKTAVAFKMIDIFDHLIQGEEKDDRVWNLILDFLNNLNSQKNYKVVSYYFLWKLFSILGYSPNLYSCSLCQSKLEYKENFLHLEEGIICPNCFRKKKKGVKINPDLIKILRVLLTDQNQFFNLKIEKEHFKELKKVSKDYLSLFVN